jgi:hypothetical protein
MNIQDKVAMMVAMAIALAATPGCGLFGGDTASYPLRPSSQIPAGEGSVAAKLEDNGNTAVKVRVKHLAPPRKLSPEANVFVVWIRPVNGAIQNVGALAVDDNLQGSIDTLTPHRRFTLMVTPEPSARVAEPSRPAVFTAEVDPEN